MVGAFDGWVDAGSAATTALDHLVEDAPVVATFDADALFDYRARRPTLHIVDGRLDELTWPELAIRRVRVSERDLLVLAGPEPDDRWQAFRDAVVEIAHRLGVVEWISLGRDPGGRAAYPFRADPGDHLRSRPPARRRATRTGRAAAGAGGDGQRARDGHGRGRHPGRRLLRPGPPLRLGAVSRRVGRAAHGPRAPPGRGAPRGRPRRRGANSCATAWTPRPPSRRPPGTTSSGSRGWSTTSGSRQAMT